MKYLIILLLVSCSPKYYYAKAVFSHNQGKIKVEILEPFKPIPDTTVVGTVIRKVK